MTTDKRALRTQKAIKEAFEALVVERPLAEITVKLLAETADINRKTFYLHYDSINDLLNAYTIRISDRLVTILKKRSFKQVIYEQAGYFFDHLQEVLHEHDAFAHALLSNDDYSQFTQKITHNVTDQLAEIIQHAYHMNDQDATITAHFMVDNTLSLLQLSLRKPGLLTTAELRGYVIRLNKNGLSSFIQ